MSTIKNKSSFYKQVTNGNNVLLFINNIITIIFSVLVRVLFKEYWSFHLLVVKQQLCCDVLTSNESMQTSCTSEKLRSQKSVTNLIFRPNIWRNSVSSNLKQFKFSTQLLKSSHTTQSYIPLL